MASGILKMWNAARGFGFIGDDEGGADTFLHISAVHSAGINPDDLTRGNRLTFDVENRVMEEQRPSTSVGRAKAKR